MIHGKTTRIDACDNCKFAAAEFGGDVISLPLHCRRFPPTYEQRVGQNGLDFVWTFPEVMPDDWCGEFVSSPVASITGRK